MIDTIHQWQSAFVEHGILTCGKPVDDHTDKLTTAERDIIASSVAIRQNTYSTGRLCAKTALHGIGFEQHQYADGLLRQSDGAVAWPAGAVGSISHTNDWAVAAVAKSGGKFASVGIDIERIDRVEKDVLRLIATDDERAALESMVELRWGRVALFSVKESLYKCLRPIYGEFIRFKDVQISSLNKPLEMQPDHESTSVDLEVEVYNPEVKLLLPALAKCCDEQRIQIRFAILPTHVVSYVSYYA